MLQGKPSDVDTEGLSEYAALSGTDHVSGAEVLDSDDGGEGGDGAENEDGWETASESEDDDSDGEWIDVHHSSDDEEAVKVWSCVMYDLKK